MVHAYRVHVQPGRLHHKRYCPDALWRTHPACVCGRDGRTYDPPATYPGTVFHGHMACLLSETSASDGGSVFVPRSATNDTEGNYIIEGYGVEPDIEVENDSKSVIEGRDPQLERAVAEIMMAIEADPMVYPTRPPDPVKTPGN